MHAVTFFTFFKELQSIEQWFSTFQCSCPHRLNYANGPIQGRTNVHRYVYLFATSFRDFGDELEKMLRLIPIRKTLIFRAFGSALYDSNSLWLAAAQLKWSLVGPLRKAYPSSIHTINPSSSSSTCSAQKI